jgi:hypothetical protein
MGPISWRCKLSGFNNALKNYLGKFDNRANFGKSER